jgi:CHAD domain-containing protein
MRAIVWLSRHSRQGPGLGQLKKTLRRLSHLLGERRTLDVLALDASHFRFDQKRLQPSVARSGQAICSRLSDKNLRKIEAQLDDAQRRLKGLAVDEFRPAFGELIAVIEGLKRMRPRSPKQWHRVRIEAKKIRYACEILRVKTDELKLIQSKLGREHDLEVLTERFGKNRKVTSEKQRILSQMKTRLPGLLNQAEDRILAYRDRL